MSKRLLRPTTILAMAIALSACGAAGSGSARPGDSAPTPATGTVPATATVTPTTAAGGLAHPIGANEIVLRFDEAGGFVPAEWTAAHVPYFTLYGDGRVVFVRTSAVVQPAADGAIAGMPVRTAVLSEEQVQDLLVLALRDGGLGTARAEYQNPMVADAATAVFEIHADGDSRTVSVMALGMDGEPGPDTAIKAALLKLANVLRDFDRGGSLGSSPYVPTAYRGVLSDASGAQGVRVRAWPWIDLAPADFKRPADPNVMQMRTRVLTPDEVRAVGVDGSESGIVGGTFLRGPDGTLYSLALRPLLPDEAT